MCLGTKFSEQKSTWNEANISMEIQMSVVNILDRSYICILLYMRYI